MKELLLPLVASPVRASVTVPGSKSLTLRYLILAALMPQETLLLGALDCDDTQSMTRCLCSLADDPSFISWEGKGQLKIYGNLLEKATRKKRIKINANDSGLTFRFLTAVAAILPHVNILFDGSPRMRQRPIGGLVDVLRELGAKIEYQNQTGFPPLLISGNSNFNKDHCAFSDSVSSQFISALMFIAPWLPKGLKIFLKGKKVSAPYLKMTLEVLRIFGIKAEENENDNAYQIDPFYQKKDNPSSFSIEPDASSACYFWALAALSGGSVLIQNIFQNSLQGDVKFLNYLLEMGCDVKESKYGITVIGSPKGLKPIVADLSDTPDQAMTLACLCMHIPWVSRLTGLQTLPHKECNRLQATFNELNRCSPGSVKKIGSDGLEIKGGLPKNPIAFHTYQDHRMAMSLSLLGLQISGCGVLNPSCVRKTFPDFFKVLEQCINLPISYR